MGSKRTRWTISKIQAEIRACMALPVRVLQKRLGVMISGVYKTGFYAGKFVETAYSCEKCSHTKKVSRSGVRVEPEYLGDQLWSLFEWRELCRVRGKDILKSGRHR